MPPVSTDKFYVLSETDRNMIAELLARFKELPTQQNPRLRTGDTSAEYEENDETKIFIALSPPYVSPSQPGGIPPTVQPRSDASFDPDVGEHASSAYCWIYKIETVVTPGPIVVASDQVITVAVDQELVYNLSSTGIAADVWIVIVREKASGRWLAIAPGMGGGGGGGGGPGVLQPSCYIGYTVIPGTSPSSGTIVWWDGFVVIGSPSGLFQEHVDSLIFNSNVFTLGVTAGQCDDPGAPAHKAITIDLNISYITSLLQHNLLSTTHPDTTPYTPPLSGDIIVGSAGLKWTRFAANTCTGDSSKPMYFAEFGTAPAWTAPMIYAGTSGQGCCAFQSCSSLSATNIQGPAAVLDFEGSCYMIWDVIKLAGFPTSCDPSQWPSFILKPYWCGFNVEDNSGVINYVDTLEFSDDFKISPQGGLCNDPLVEHNTALIELDECDLGGPPDYLHPSNGTGVEICSISFDQVACTLTVTYKIWEYCSGRRFGPPKGPFSKSGTSISLPCGTD